MEESDSRIAQVKKLYVSLPLEATPIQICASFSSGLYDPYFPCVGMRS